MSDYIIDGAILTDIADAVREKTGAIEPIVPENMAEMLRNLEGDYERGYAEGYENGYENGKNDSLTEFIGNEDYFVTGKVINLEDWKYFQDTKVTAVKFPYTTTIGSSAFSGCSRLVSANFPLATYIKNNAFEGCSKLVSVYLPLVKVFGGSVFKGDTSLGTVDLPALNTIWEMAFYNCISLKTVILRLNRVCELKRVDVFYNTPIANGTGFVYVPDNIVEQYKTADNWSTYASQIKPISELEE